MHVAADLNWFLQFVSLAFAAAFGFLYLVRNCAYRYFAVDSNFGSTTTDFSSDRRSREAMAAGAAVGGAAEVSDSCAVCGLRTTKQCARCKMVKYCSETCQRSHWNSEHKRKCQELQSFNKANRTKLTSVLRERKASLVPARGSSKICKNSNKILFPYEEFLKFFKWDKPAYTPCGLINCGNSCFANVVLQCLSYTRPLVAYLLEKGHKMECQMDDWCFLCEFQTHVERASQSVAPFSPINILSQLPNIGGNLGYGKQEDAHEFMRFAIDTMQSACLEDFGGEKAVPPVYQQTTLIQHIFGGRLQSQVICTECNNVSNQFENMMDLTVEIHGDAVTLEECLHQFTAKELLHGDNMYKCDGCNDYVKAWKCLSIQHAPNILTIALKRFQGGRFGKLNKRVNFPEKLDLRFYTVDLEDGNNYELYAVIVHVDMLNASFFGHYICYVKDFCGNWYRIDDCEVASVDLDEVLSQGAYMLLYSRVCAQPSCLLPAELLNKQENENVKIQAADPSAKQQNECLSAPGCIDTPLDSEQLSPANCSRVGVKFEQDLSSFTNSEDANGEVKMASSEAGLPISNGELHNYEDLVVAPKQVDSLARPTIEPALASTIVIDNSAMQLDANNFVPSTSNAENTSLGSRSYASEGLPRIVTEESTAAENCTLEEGNMRDFSPTTAGVGSEVNSANVGNAECRSGSSLSSENETKKAAKNSTAGSSGAKLKPVLVPGFLGKPPRKGIKQKTPKIHLNNQKNEVGGTLFVA